MTVFDDTVPTSPAYPDDMSAQGDQAQKLRMRPWLEQQLDTDQYHGFCWLDKKERKFKVPWIHASSQHFNHTKHSAVFKAWAVHTGRFDPESSDVCYEKVSLWKTWKANFRCALNSLPDVVELRGETCKAKGEAAYKVYRIVDRKQKRRKSSRGKQALTSSQPRTSPPVPSHKTGRVEKKRSAPSKNCRQHRGKQLAALVRQTREAAPSFGCIEQYTSEKLPSDHACYTKSEAPSDSADSLLTFPPSVPEASHGSPRQLTDMSCSTFPLTYVKTESSSDDGLSDCDNSSDISDNAPTDEEVVEDVLGLEETHSNRGNSPARDGNELEETGFPNAGYPTAFMQSPNHWCPSGNTPNSSVPGWLPSTLHEQTFQNTAASCALSSVNGAANPAVVVQPSRSLDPLTNPDSLLPSLGMDESTMKEIMSILMKARTTPTGQAPYHTTLTTTARLSVQQSVNYGGLANTAQASNAPTRPGLVQNANASPIPMPNYFNTPGASNTMDTFNSVVPTTSTHAQPQSLLHSLVQSAPTNIITTTTVSG
ncbi:uncharacterized protein [Branchiostoma lanceolatum]|uniref:uncharacterized protein n=1 Tax=Branchiostoma lanceolatum TaxID=7740 RepID=UPI0034533D0A